MAEIVIQTERLNLRTWDEGDIVPFDRHVNTAAVMRWLGGVQTFEQVTAGYHRIAQCSADHGHCFWIVERREDGALLGFCGLKRINAPGAPAHILGEFEVGWRLREDAWGQGYAREAALASLDRGFEVHSASRIIALTVIENEGSWGLMKRLGMKRRTDLDFVEPHGATDSFDVIVYAMERRDWLSCPPDR